MKFQQKKPHIGSPRAHSKRSPSIDHQRAFTLVEVLIAVTLGLAVMAAVLNTYTFVARNFTRSLGIVSANQPSLEAQTRNALALLTQDVQMAVALQSSPSSNAVNFTVPYSAGTRTIAYYYNSSSSSATVTLAGSSKTVPANSLVRVDGNTGVMLTLQSGIISLNFRYYDSAGVAYTVFNTSTTGFNSYLGIKQISVEYTCQGGNADNGTQTQVFSSSSRRLVMRNKPLLQ